MDAMLVYIDDVLGSTFRRGLRDEEQLGYALLCLHAAKSEHEGLPSDEFTLASLSELGKQWFRKPSGSNETRGARIKRGFFEKDGRIFNSRVLAEVDKFRVSKQKRHEVATAGAAARWGDASRNPNAGSMQPACSKHPVSNAEAMLNRCQPMPMPTPTTDTHTLRASESTWSGPDYEDLARQIWDKYPKARRGPLRLVQDAVLAAFSPYPSDEFPDQAARCMANLAGYLASDDVAKGVCYGAAKWVADGHWQTETEVDADAPHPRKAPACLIDLEDE